MANTVGGFELQSIADAGNISVLPLMLVMACRRQYSSIQGHGAGSSHRVTVVQPVVGLRACRPSVMGQDSTRWVCKK